MENNPEIIFDLVTKLKEKIVISLSDSDFQLPIQRFCETHICKLLVSTLIRSEYNNVQLKDMSFFILYNLSNYEKLHEDFTNVDFITQFINASLKNESVPPVIIQQLLNLIGNCLDSYNFHTLSIKSQLYVVLIELANHNQNYIDQICYCISRFFKYTMPPGLSNTLIQFLVTFSGTPSSISGIYQLSQEYNSLIPNFGQCLNPQVVFSLWPQSMDSIRLVTEFIRIGMGGWISFDAFVQAWSTTGDKICLLNYLSNVFFYFPAAAKNSLPILQVILNCIDSLTIDAAGLSMTVIMQAMEHNEAPVLQLFFERQLLIKSIELLEADTAIQSISRLLIFILTTPLFPPEKRQYVKGSLEDCSFEQLVDRLLESFPDETIALLQQKYCEFIESN